ncbi:conserved hypothetical protein [Culex quinquefasciatus]|uniref:Uncharacterized protein n=1 Tax=Culex quinquefasciatus TaxID=7176 RepID=B0WUF2_CULQU|nr:conserved hypothetical protein [Culex quinquefasciatus]|eukprot:XP_001870942.1 conserved hypothetical protein [Culex quinquefasciatus]
MKFIAVLVATACLVSGIQAADTLLDFVTGNITVQLNTLNANVLTFNTSLTAGDSQNRFQSYPTLSSSGLASVLSTLGSVSYNPLTTDPSLSSLNSTVQSAAQQTISQFTMAVQNMTSQPLGIFSASCLLKYGLALTAKPISLSRFGECLTNETARLAIVAQNVSSAYASSATFAQSLFSLSSICTVPTVAQLTPSGASPYTPSTQCIQANGKVFMLTFGPYLSDMSQIPTYVMFADSARWSQTGLIYSRVQRCATFVQADIQDSINRVQNSFGTCLSTGK